MLKLTTQTEGATFSIDPAAILAVEALDQGARVYVGNTSVVVTDSPAEIAAAVEAHADAKRTRGLDELMARLPEYYAQVMEFVEKAQQTDEQFVERKHHAALEAMEAATPALPTLGDCLDAQAIARDHHERWRILRDRSYSPFFVPWDQLTDDKQKELTDAIVPLIRAVLAGTGTDLPITNPYDTPAEIPTEGIAPDTDARPSESIAPDEPTTEPA